MNKSWEACFSSISKDGPCQMAQTKRAYKIHAFYTTLDGKKAEEEMEEYTAKLFQHECDHLDGIVNVEKSSSSIKEFETYEEFEVAIKEISKKYKAPVALKPRS